MTLDRYVLRLFLTRTIFAIVVLIALVQVLELLDMTTPILQRGLGLAGIGRYSLLRLPGMFEQISPLGVLVGSLFTFTQMARTSEMVVIRATGANIYRVLRMMAPVAIGVGLLDFAIASEVSPRTQDALVHWMAITAPPATAKPAKQHWFRLGRDLVLIGAVSEDGHLLSNLRIYRRDSTSLLTHETAAATATPEAGGWRLHGATTVNIAGDRAAVGGPAELDWKTPLTPSGVIRLFRAGDEVTTSVAAGALANAAPIDRSPGYYLTRLNRTFAAPIAALVMLLLSAPAALSSMRSDQGTRLMMFGLGSGLLFMVADGLLTAMGETGAVPAVLAAWSAPLAFAALAVTVLLYAEG